MKCTWCKHHWEYFWVPTSDLGAHRHKICVWCGIEWCFRRETAVSKLTDFDAPLV